MSMKKVCLAAAVLLLAACAAQKTRQLPPVSPVQAEAAQQRREAILSEKVTWSFLGRVAVSNGKNGGGGRIEWKQDGELLSSVEIRAPITKQTWRLTTSEHHVRIDGLEGGPRQGTDIEQLLRETTGWEIPFVAMSDWVRGVRGYGAMNVQYDAKGRLVHVEQEGWAINYAWPQMSPDEKLPMPQRIDAVKGDAKVKLIIDEWTQ